MPSSTPSDQDVERYLSKTGVGVFIQDALTLMLENRPEHPIRFLAEYFQAAVKPGSALSRGYRYIRTTPRNRPAFMSNLVSAFVVLDTSKTGTKSCGLTFKEMQKLLRLLANDFPIDILSPMIHSMKICDSDLVDFELFHLSVVAVLEFEELFEKLEWVFKGYDPESSGYISGSMLNEIIAIMRRNENFCQQCIDRSPKKLLADLPKQALSYKEFLALTLQILSFLPTESTKI